MADKKLTAKDIVVLERRPLYRPTVIPIYVVLGMLGEYRGRRVVEHGEVIERFYPHERPLAEEFTRYLLRAATCFRVTGEVDLKVEEQGHISVISRPLARLVNAFYLGSAHQTGGSRVPRRRRRISWVGSCSLDGSSGSRWLNACLDAAVFPRMDNGFIFRPDQVDPRFSYLLGVHRRYGKANRFRFANSFEKVALVRDTLIELGCEDITHRLCLRGAPSGHLIEFEPTEDLKLFLGIEGAGSSPEAV